MAMHLSDLQWRCLFLAVFAVCAGCEAGDRKSGGDAAEKTVRDVLAQQLKVDAAAIPMDTPISSPPLRADDLDLVEIVMELEERHGVTIADDDVERFAGGKLGQSPARITPNQLASILREAQKMQRAKKRH